jgi:EmrB/QacA subfamily drug resistance transporter
MGQTDASIAQLVLPELRRSFHEPVRAVAWVAIAYLLVVTAMLPTVGRLSDILGRKLLYCCGFLVFVVGSGLCGLAPNLDLLIGARVLQALGATLMAANSVAIIVATVGLARRGQALGVQAAAQAVGLSVGPALGGFLISVLDWRWVFWINVPVGLIGAAIAFIVLPRTEQARNPGRFDLLGAILLAPGLALLLLALNQASRLPIGSPLLLGSIALSLALLIGFVYRQLHVQSPLIDSALFSDAGFVTGNVGALLTFAILFGAFFVMPFVLVQVYGCSPLTAGLRLTVIPVALGLAAPISGALYNRVGARPLKVAGTLMLLASSLMLAYVFAAGAPRLALLTGLLALLGVGQGAFTAPNNSEVMGAAAAGETGQAAGLLQMFRTFGMSLGISLASLILSLQLHEAAGRPPPMELPAADVARGAAVSFMVFAALALFAALLSLVRVDRSGSPRHG